MSEHSDQVYFRHILDAIDKTAGYVKDITYSDFLKNDLIIDAVLRNLEIIGEASNNVSADFKENHLDINFRPAVSMRNQLIHSYDDVDLKVVWDTLTEDLPVLRAQLAELC